MPVCILTLKQRADFVRLRRGRKFTTPCFILRAAPSPIESQQEARVGYTVTTKCGNAVRRNRIKRRLRALVREIFPEHARPGHDYILIAIDTASPSAAEIGFEQLRGDLQRAVTGIRYT